MGLPPLSVVQIFSIIDLSAHRRNHDIGERYSIPLEIVDCRVDRSTGCHAESDMLAMCIQDVEQAGQITIIFTDGLTTVDELTNIKLSAAFTSTADDTMTLVYDGTNWYEVSRSVN